ncbi:MAG: hypothetical protein PWP46_676 [Fusobacteriaceae bacterium]|jgi:5'-nucleotidase (lipoprotein e(P4) family)|nr:5-nucleotidase, lipoprotein e(P4) family [Fusobacteriales bacterium]MDN5303797.1 hypothetical protein [Fusobacteriaceae bacterium]
MYKIIYKLIIINLIIFSISFSKDFTEKNLEMESYKAVSWMQNSSEYKLLCNQAFNIAKENLNKIKSENKGKMAVVVDLDETMLDNSPYAAWRIYTGNGFSSDTWSEWVAAKEAKAIPGAVEFSKYVKELGMNIIYISNRSESELKDTMLNMKKLGFAQVDKNHIFLKTTTSDKTARREYIEKLGYDIVMLIGDQLSDFSNIFYNASNKTRNSLVIENKNKFGNNWIVIPNPSYGDFESIGITNEFYVKITGETTSNYEKSKLRESSLNIWDGE